LVKILGNMTSRVHYGILVEDAVCLTFMWIQIQIPGLKMTLYAKKLVKSFFSAVYLQYFPFIIMKKISVLSLRENEHF
jgi:hypothetical protein